MRSSSFVAHRTDSCDGRRFQCARQGWETEHTRHLWRRCRTDEPEHLTWTGSRRKGYMVVKHLIEVEKLSVEDVFTRSFDVQALERDVWRSL